MAQLTWVPHCNVFPSPNGTTTTFTLTGVPSGTYAVAGLEQIFRNGLLQSGGDYSLTTAAVSGTTNLSIVNIVFAQAPLATDILTANVFTAPV